MSSIKAHTNPFNIVAMIRNFFTGPDTHVRISDKGRQVLNNKVLAEKLIQVVHEKQEQLEKGERVDVADGVTVQLVTSLHDQVNESK